MDVVRLWIPYGFIRNRVRMTWREILFGLDEELLDPSAPTHLATDIVDEANSPDSRLVDLAGLSAHQDARPYVEALAAREPEEPLPEIKAKWLCVSLAWLYERRNEYEDPLREVAKVYADFDYPERIASFVHYMPMDEPDLGSRELNEARLYQKWKDYLDDCWSEHARHLGTR